MAPENFIQQYEAALASQDWQRVAPLIHADACVTFSNGTVHNGKAAIQRAFERNFALIENEHYAMTNVTWVLRREDYAVYLFEFRWRGLIGGKAAQGAGRGTGVLLRENGLWHLLCEHLGPKAPEQ